jgi:putative peptide zinc metalloprotease protein
MESFAQLRQELNLYPGPPMDDGQPTWTVHDPARNLFFRLDWLTFEIVSRWSMANVQAIVDSVNTSTTLHIAQDDVQAVNEFLTSNQLLQMGGETAAQNYAKRKAEKWANPLKQLLHNYLFFRIPLVKPDAFLTRMLPVANLLYSATFLKLTVLVAFVGFYLVYRNWDQFTVTFMDLLSWEGLLSIGLAIIAVKIAHEFGHAFTSKRYGCRVPTMGVAFLVLFPMAYTDTNEAWKLQGKNARLAIASAGMVTEFLIAVWSTLAWAILPEGTPKAIAFLFATTTWVTTLAINASPFLRFDGYFILSDWLDMPNMHHRSFALARWRLRELLFNLGEEPPEYFPPSRRRWLILFAWAVWIYRLVIFLGIALLVYHFFIKAVGIILFIVEIMWFILLPIIRELKEWAKRWKTIIKRRRSFMSFVPVCLLLGLIWLPWPSPIRVAGLLRPAQEFTFYAPYPGQVIEMPFQENSPIKAGQMPMSLLSYDLGGRSDEANAKIGRLNQQLKTSKLDQEYRQSMRVIEQELAAARSEKNAISSEMKHDQLLAPFDGVIRDLDPLLQPGVWVSARQKLGTLVNTGAWLAETYLDEESVRLIQAGETARFYPDEPRLESVGLRIISIEKDATHSLNRPMLASQFGGTVMTREQKGKHIPETAVYRVMLLCDEPVGELAGHSWRGRVVFQGSWVSPASVLLNRSLAVLRREAGF